MGTLFSCFINTLKIGRYASINQYTEYSTNIKMLHRSIIGSKTATKDHFFVGGENSTLLKMQEKCNAGFAASMNVRILCYHITSVG